ncbi:MAG: transcriptional regulator [Chloroflexi bacterium]|nr:transcriptional regulator [Chloroflexota bacterium]MBK6712478.1 transcriptional regulator [Chloroflexota bacterium]MBK7178330.1 transcriptional regulator [Chloroflexota bacterium]MBK7916440.1 transcriptional regulator [Chloroflexota bacterium]MBK8933820.1 transcriptional regulator [Chloroflexota bacterium]
MARLATRTARLREIESLLLLAPEGLTAVELADDLGVDRRTVYRDVEFLCDQGVPVWQENGRFGINRSRYLASIRLSFQEAMALVLAGLLLSRTVEDRNPHVMAALRKLASTLPKPLSNHLQRAADRVDQRETSSQGAVLEAVAEGWGTGQQVKIGYRSPRSGVLRQRVICPYALEPTPSGIYVIGHDSWSDEIRTFKLDRLESAAVLKKKFTIPEDFDLEARLASGWRIMAGDEVNEVVLRFAPEVNAQVRERQWHPSQTLEATPAGGCLLRVQVAEPLEMKPWIRSWGAQVEVLAPGWLRADLAVEMRQAAALYIPQAISAPTD